MQRKRDSTYSYRKNLYKNTATEATEATKEDMQIVDFLKEDRKELEIMKEIEQVRRKKRKEGEGEVKKPDQ